MEQNVTFPPGYIVGMGISALSCLGILFCLVMVLIPLFKKEGPGLGILGIFCSIYAYIWGWLNAKALNLKKIMLLWTALVVVGIIGYAIATVSFLKANADNMILEPPVLEAPAQ